MAFPSVAERRRRVKVSDLVVVDHGTSTSSGTEESYLLTSDSSEGNSVRGFISTGSVENDFLRAISGESRDEELSLWENSVEVPLLASESGVSTRTCSCLPTFRPKLFSNRMRSTRYSSADDDQASNIYESPYQPFENRIEIVKTSSTDGGEPESLTSDSSMEAISESDVELESHDKKGYFQELSGDIQYSEEDEESVFGDSADEPLLKSELVSTGCQCKSLLRPRRHRLHSPGLETTSTLPKTNKSGQVCQCAYQVIEDRLEVNMPSSVIAFERNKKNKAGVFIPSTASTANQRSSYITDPSLQADPFSYDNNLLRTRVCKNIDLHNELDELVHSVGAPLDTMRAPLDYQLSTLYEEDEDLITQSTPSIIQSTPSRGSQSKTQKLAEYLRRDGDADFDYYGGLSPQSSLGMSSGEDEELAGLFFALDGSCQTLAAADIREVDEVVNSRGEGHSPAQERIYIMNTQHEGHRNTLKKYQKEQEQRSASPKCSSIYNDLEGARSADGIIFPGASEEISELTEEFSPVVGLLPNPKPKEQPGIQTPNPRETKNHGRQGPPGRPSCLSTRDPSPTDPGIASSSEQGEKKPSVRYQELSKAEEELLYYRNMHPNLDLEGMQREASTSPRHRSRDGTGRKCPRQPSEETQQGSTMCKSSSLPVQRITI
jgi:hypothetical protein